MNVFNLGRLPARHLLAGVWLATSVAAAMAQAASVEPVVAALGTVKITQGEVALLLNKLPPAERGVIVANPATLDPWLRQRLASVALFDEARRKGWTDRPEVKARVNAAAAEITQHIVTAAYLESVAQLPPGFPSDAELKTAYEQGKASFKLPAAYRVAQIFLAAPASDAAAVAKVRPEAEKLALQARGGDFAALARSRSEEPRSAAQGGDAGLLPLAQLLPEVRTAVAQLKIGEVSDALLSAGGFHIVKLLESQPERVATFEEMRPQLQLALRQQRQQQLVQAHMAQLAPAESIQINSAALDAAVQQRQ
ncbi:peptidylprolyl isomerase [Variovorax sp. HJSM1_2]|uniref:peptidylprolyl isomerase n=1 Tax=Variovorax sp. HJSM1_2 TaxID=3366263 RepID=UPI003BEA0887